MARKKRKLPLGVRPIAQDIEEGRNISGQKGFVKLDFDGNDIFVPVVIQGMKVADEGSCGITLRVKPQGGFEDFTVSPCDFYSSKAELESMRASQAKVEQAESDYSEIGKWGTAQARKRAALEYVSKHGLEDMYKDEMSGEDTDGQRLTVMKVLVSAVYELSPEEMDNANFYGWRSGRGWYRVEVGN